MKLLLDTHIVLWWLDDPARISPAARDRISEPANTVFVSAASAWEIAIKQKLGKLTIPPDFVEAILACGFQMLPVTIGHALSTLKLPLLHHDPFDRMLIAQSLAEDASLVTRDELIQGYDVRTIVG